MSIASLIGNNLRATARQRELTPDEVQTWSALQLLENLPDGGWSQLEVNELTHQRTFSISADLLHTALSDLKVTPSVCAWIAFHSKGSRERAHMWAAIVVNVVSHLMQTDPVLLMGTETNANPERYGEMALARQRRTIKLQDIAVAMGNKIPTDNQFDLVWASTMLANGQHELALPRSWS